VGRHLDVGRIVAQGREEQLGESHGTKHSEPDRLPESLARGGLADRPDVASSGRRDLLGFATCPTA
jgi:hypothetical protein